MYKLVAAILVGNGVGGRMATAPHYITIATGVIRGFLGQIIASGWNLLMAGLYPSWNGFR